jgi:CubicO group peptidase (beta-lactamase class C family)
MRTLVAGLIVAVCSVLAVGSVDAEPLPKDTPETTASGNSFIAPAGWSVRVQGKATIVAAPEGDSWIALVDVEAPDADQAVTAAWAVYKPTAKWALEGKQDLPDRDGWTGRRDYAYLTSPNERRDVTAQTLFAHGTWTVVLFDVSQPVAEKRLSQVQAISDRLLPKGYERETFARKTAHPLDEARLAELEKFVDHGREILKMPGVGLGIVQGGKVLFAGGFGQRSLDAPAPVDADTLFLIASNTKALTTLLLAKEVEAGRFTWETPVTTLLPSFRLGSAETTHQVLVKHLICACTGMPRQDLEWLFEFGSLTPESALASMATMQPTSKFGEMFQYSNLMAGAAGFLAGHVMFPDLELGAAYDRALQTTVLDPLGMKATTFDFKRALSGNHAMPFGSSIDGATEPAVMEINYAAYPVRPAGGAWSDVRDMLRYVSMELAEGKLPDGSTYIAPGPLLIRREPQVAIGKDATYGMGLSVDSTYGVPVVHHGGDFIGYHSDMIWIPSQNVGAVILTNSDTGPILRSVFRRKLLEVLFDGKSLAGPQLESSAKNYFDDLALQRKLLTVPPDPSLVARLASHYHNAGLGNVDVRNENGTTVFDFGEWKSAVASRKNPDGTASFVTIAPGIAGVEFVVGTGADRTLVVRDGQHEYLFTTH